MKKLLFCIGIIFCVSNVYSQKIKQDEAKNLLEKVYTYLKSNDTASFISLWYLDNTSIFNKPPFKVQDVKENFKELEYTFMVPLAANLKFDRIDIEDMPADVFGAPYKIKAWFKLGDNIGQGYGFLVDHINNKWVIRFHGETTVKPNYASK